MHPYYYYSDSLICHEMEPNVIVYHYTRAIYDVMGANFSCNVIKLTNEELLCCLKIYDCLVNKHMEKMIIT